MFNTLSRMSMLLLDPKNQEKYKRTLSLAMNNDRYQSESNSSYNYFKWCITKNAKLKSKKLKQQQKNFGYKNVN